MKRSKPAQRRRDGSPTADSLTAANHELRAPLTSIAGALGLLIGGAAGELPPSATTLLRIAYANSERLVRLLDEIFDTGKFQAEDVLPGRQGVRGSRIQTADCNRDHVAERTAVRCIGTGRARPRVLHVDDDCDVLHIVAEMLRADAEVVSARSIAAARHAIAESDIDFAMIDLALGDGGGLELLPALQKADGQTIPTIVFSGDDRAPDFIAGVDAVLTKSAASLNRVTAMVRQMASRDGKPRAAHARGANIGERRRQEVA